MRANPVDRRKLSRRHEMKKWKLGSIVAPQYGEEIWTAQIDYFASEGDLASHVGKIEVHGTRNKAEKIARKVAKFLNGAA